jgi:phospholipase/carboxylesterase
MLNDYRLQPISGTTKHIVMFLHGLGDRGDGGLLSICQMWQRSMLDCEFICPDAPFPFDMAPPEFGGRQWFSLADMSPPTIAAGVAEATPILNSYIDKVLAERNLSADCLALVGFSQGTMMALHVGLRRPHKIACILGYSGLLGMVNKLADEKQSAPSVMLIHGTADEIVPFARMAEAEAVLKTNNIAVRTLACAGLGHSIDESGILQGQRFLLENFG